MKFRNKKTGEVFEHNESAFCGIYFNESCYDCPIKNPNDCNGWIRRHPQEAAELMGYELVEGDMKKPRICEALGVEVMERFKVPGRSIEYYIAENGLIYDEKGYRSNFSDFAEAINNPEKVFHIPKWTDQEKQDAKTILRMFGKDNFTHVTKDRDGWPSIMDGDGKDPNTGWCSIGMEKDMFPTLKPGETVLLADIVGNN